MPLLDFSRHRQIIAGFAVTLAVVTAFVSDQIFFARLMSEALYLVGIGLILYEVMRRTRQWTNIRFFPLYVLLCLLLRPLVDGLAETLVRLVTGDAAFSEIGSVFSFYFGLWLQPEALMQQVYVTPLLIPNVLLPLVLLVALEYTLLSAVFNSRRLVLFLLAAAISPGWRTGLWGGSFDRSVVVQLGSILVAAIVYQIACNTYYVERAKQFRRVLHPERSLQSGKRKRSGWLLAAAILLFFIPIIGWVASLVCWIAWFFYHKPAERAPTATPKTKGVSPFVTFLFIGSALTLLFPLLEALPAIATNLLPRLMWGAVGLFVFSMIPTRMDKRAQKYAAIGFGLLVLSILFAPLNVIAMETISAPRADFIDLIDDIVSLYPIESLPTLAFWTNWTDEILAGVHRVLQIASIIGAGYVLTYQLPGYGARQAAAIRTPLFSVLSGRFGGSSMQPTHSETTRLVASNVVLGGPKFRHQLDEYLNQSQFKALAPELGLDLKLVAQVSEALEARERRFAVIFAGITLFACGMMGFIGGIVSLISRGRSGGGFIGFVLPVLMFVFASWVVYVIKTYTEWFQLSEPFKRQNFDPTKVSQEFGATLDQQTLQSIPDESNNVIVYSGFIPFVGAGHDAGGWSFALNIDNPAQNEITNEPKQIKSFQIAELYDTLEKDICNLDLPNLVVKDCLYINGLDVNGNETLLPNPYARPLQHVDDDMIKPYIAGGDPSVRHYKWIRIHDWGNELILSNFVRFTKRGPNLFVEFSMFLLTPIADQWRQIDRLPANTGLSFIGAALGGIFVAPFHALASLGSLLNVVRKAILGRGGDDAEARTAIKNKFFQYGADHSLRAWMSSHNFMHYFQKLDNEMYVKIIQRQILNSISEFLEVHNIDTSEIKDRRNTIMNSGIIVQGGDITGTLNVAGRDVKVEQGQAGQASPAPAPVGA